MSRAVVVDLATWRERRDALALLKAWRDALHRPRPAPRTERGRAA